MATIDSRDVIETLLKNDGFYPGDPQCHSIYLYENTISKKWSHMVAYSQLDVDNMSTSSMVGRNCLLWSKEEHVTNEGRQYLDKKEPEEIFAEG